VRGVERHLCNAFDIAAGRFRRANINAEAPGNRRTDLFGIELPP